MVADNRTRFNVVSYAESFDLDTDLAKQNASRSVGEFNDSPNMVAKIGPTVGTRQKTHGPPSTEPGRSHTGATTRPDRKHDLEK